MNILNKIDKILFEDNFDSIVINYKDYEEFFIKNSIHNRFEPVTHIDLLKNGICGFLKGPNQEVAKPICISRDVERGKVLGHKIF